MSQAQGDAEDISIASGLTSEAGTREEQDLSGFDVAPAKSAKRPEVLHNAHNEQVPRAGATSAKGVRNEEDQARDELFGTKKPAVAKVPGHAAVGTQDQARDELFGTRKPAAAKAAGPAATSPQKPQSMPQASSMAPAVSPAPSSPTNETCHVCLIFGHCCMVYLFRNCAVMTRYRHCARLLLWTGARLIRLTGAAERGSNARRPGRQCWQRQGPDGGHWIRAVAMVSH